MLRIKLSIIILLFPVVLLAQERQTDFGSAFSVSLEKRLGERFDISLDEELRLLTNNNYGFDRLASTVGVDYLIIRKKLKAGLYYSNLYMYNSSNYYENRHRYSFSLIYKESFGKYTVSWRGRVQGTLRDEDRGDYKINPKYVLRNKFEIKYLIRGSRWEPYLFTETTNTLNDPLGNEIYKIRFQGGSSWRLDRTSYLEFFLRWNEYLIMPDPRVISIGIGYKKNL